MSEQNGSGGFDAEWQPVMASDFTLPHRRERLYVVAYANGEHGETGMGTESKRTPPIFVRSTKSRMAIRVQTTDRFIGVDDGIRGRTYRLRGSALGNAVVPQVAQWIGERIMEAELQRRLARK